MNITPYKTPGFTAAILMASGFSKRFGQNNKLLFPFEGKALARHTLELVCDFSFPAGIFFVTATEETASLSADLNTVKVVRNHSPCKGLRESIRLGIEAANPNTEYFIFFPCDQPFLDAATVRLVLEAARQGCIVEPRYKGKPGNPCLFSADFREELLSLKEGETPRVLKTRHSNALISVEINNPLAHEDIDDEKSLETLVRKVNELCLLPKIF